MKWYDLIEDWELIESSFAEQYGIRLVETENMTWKEFYSLLSGISSETALGRMISIRSEEDREVLKSFTTEQKSERSRWRASQANLLPETDIEMSMATLEQMLASAFG